MLVMDNTINVVRSGGKRKAALVIEDEQTRDEKKARQVNQCLIEVCSTPSHPNNIGAFTPLNPSP